MKIVFFGSSKFVIPVIEFLKDNYDLELVVTTEKNMDPVPAYCRKNKIPLISVYSTKELQSVKQEISNTKSIVAVLAYFGLIVTEDLIDIFPKGIINIHPSLLPKYRGPTPVQTAILNGDEETGVSIMLLDRDIDHGPLLAQEKEKINSRDTTVSLYERLFPKGVKLLEEVLLKYISGNLKPVQQDHSKATFTKSLSRESGYIDPNNQLLNRMIRAYYPWPGVWTEVKIKNKVLRIKFLPNKMLHVEGKKPMSYKDFINGYLEGEKILRQLQLV